MASTSTDMNFATPSTRIQQVRSPTVPRRATWTVILVLLWVLPSPGFLRIVHRREQPCAESLSLPKPPWLYATLSFIPSTIDNFCMDMQILPVNKTATSILLFFWPIGRSLFRHSHVNNLYTTQSRHWCRNSTAYAHIACSSKNERRTNNKELFISLSSPQPLYLQHFIFCLLQAYNVNVTFCNKIYNSSSRGGEQLLQQILLYFA